MAQTFGYSKVETPLLEDAKLFHFWTQGTNKRLLMVPDEKNSRIALKPTNLFSLARAYLEHGVFEKERMTKWYCFSPIGFVKESGELKQGYEYGLQVFGEITPVVDAQLINLLLRLYKELGFGNVTVEINNIGCLECTPAYREVLKSFLKEKRYELCEACHEQWDKEPLQVLACTNLSCSAATSEAPALVDFLCERCHHHFVDVLESLDELGIAYNLNPKIVGDVWSRKTVFELHLRSRDEEIILGRGGRADDLIQSLSGPPMAALGFYGGAEGIMRITANLDVKISDRQKIDVFLVPVGELAAKKTLKLFTDLWNHEIAASEFIGPGSIKTQLKMAESSKVDIALIIGQKEAREGTVILRDVRSGMQELFDAAHIIEEVKKRLGK